MKTIWISKSLEHIYYQLLGMMMSNNTVQNDVWNVVASFSGWLSRKPTHLTVSLLVAHNWTLQLCWSEIGTVIVIVYANVEF